LNETDLRKLLSVEAEQFRPDSDWLAQITPRQRPGRVRMAFSLAAIVAVTLVSVVTQGRVDDRSEPLRGAERPVYIRLTGYEAETGGEMPSSLLRHLSCMRDHGFDLPEPIPANGGWTIVVANPEAIGFGTARWTRAAFDTCALVRDRAS
jgi:hypothetical protein